MPEILRYTAFADHADGGNPAGVVLDARGLDDAAMLAIAADLGYSESAFLMPAAAAGGPLGIRYFSPQAEVPFCGHATIAAAVAHADAFAPGPLALDTASGRVDVDVEVRDGATLATLTSVTPRVEPLDGPVLQELFAALRWRPSDLGPDLPPRVGYAGAFHPILVARSAQRLADLDYDFPRLQALMAAQGWTTVALVHRRDATTFEARNPFPPGGVVEDPATGASAAALGAYLRALRAVTPPVTLTIHQGAHVGRPSLLEVDVPVGEATGIRVRGRAVPIPD